MFNKNKVKNIFWESVNESLIIRKRLIEKAYAQFVTFTWTPLIIIILLISIFLYIVDDNFTFDAIELNKKYISEIIIISFTGFFMYIFVPIYCLTALIWIPVKLKINKKGIVLHRFLIFKIFIEFNDVKNISFIENITYSSMRGVGFKNKSWILLVILKNNKRYKLFTIKSDIVPDYYNDLLNKINYYFKK